MLPPLTAVVAGNLEHSKERQALYSMGPWEDLIQLQAPRTHTLSPVYPWAHLRCLSSSSSA